MALATFCCISFGTKIYRDLKRNPLYRILVSLHEHSHQKLPYYFFGCAFYFLLTDNAFYIRKLFFLISFENISALNDSISGSSNCKRL